jgi:hypothetical protein
MILASDKYNEPFLFTLKFSSKKEAEEYVAKNTNPDYKLEVVRYS